MNNSIEISSLYLHFPFCRHLCNYCDFYKSVPKNKDSEYESFEASLKGQFDHFKEHFSDSNFSFKSLNTLYLGGGTPSLWGKRGALYLQKFLLDRNINLGPDCEFTLEVNPGAWNEEGLTEFINTGANRFSLGIQSLDQNFLKIIDRVHNIDDVHETLSFFKENDLSFSVDFMLGLPFSEKYQRNIQKELEEILSYNPEHISLYILTTKAGYVHKTHLPSDEYIEKEYLLVSNFLKERGFSHYEVSNFSKVGKESKHNLRYWESESVMALGASATGFIKELSTRFKWKTQSSTFTTEVLTKDELLLEEIYMALRINRPILLSDYFSDEAKVDKVLTIWRERGLLEQDDKEGISLNSNGFLILDSLLDDLFREKLLD